MRLQGKGTKIEGKWKEGRLVQKWVGAPPQLQTVDQAGPDAVVLPPLPPACNP